MKNSIILLILGIALSFNACKDDTPSPLLELPDITGYPIVGTKQTTFYDNTSIISEPSTGDAFFGQNANYPGNVPEYVNNGNGTVTDMVTGLMWFQSADLNNDGTIDVYDKLSQAEALEYAESCELGGYNDWRLPTIKEAYSLILFNGKDPSGMDNLSTDQLVPFLDDVFEFGYGDEANGERIIDAQFASSTIYVGLTMQGNRTMFGVNLADGRIKGYPTDPMPGQLEGKQFYVLLVRGNDSYGENDFLDNGDGTITDNATGLMWMQDDNSTSMSWEDALKYANTCEFAQYSDWRVPSAKELQSIVDYTRSPETSSSPAIDPIFSCTQITNEKGEADYPYYWTNTTHENMSTDAPGGNAVYVAFGRALGYMEGEWLDVHGAGAQRSDPKTGSAANYPTGHGPQGDAIRVLNYVRLVRDVK